MKDEVFYGKGIHELEGEYPDLYELVKNISDVVYDGYALDYKTQKLIAIGITASRADPRATKKQIKREAISHGILSDHFQSHRGNRQSGKAADRGIRAAVFHRGSVCSTVCAEGFPAG